MTDIPVTLTVHACAHTAPWPNSPDLTTLGALLHARAGEVFTYAVKLVGRDRSFVEFTSADYAFDGIAQVADLLCAMATADRRVEFLAANGTVDFRVDDIAAVHVTVGV